MKVFRLSGRERRALPGVEVRPTDRTVIVMQTNLRVRLLFIVYITSRIHLSFIVLWCVIVSLNCTANRAVPRTIGPFPTS
jgi:hypothetical protein